MKELTIEEKASRYAEAIKRAKFYKENTDEVGAKDVSDLIEGIFPELKKSEDEKIRNFISNELVCLRASDEKSSDRYNELTEAIAWLEKQGEQKSTWSKEDETALSDALWCCKQAASIAKDENEMGNVWYAEKWLKSLKERMKGEQYDN